MRIAIYNQDIDWRSISRLQKPMQIFTFLARDSMGSIYKLKIISDSKECIQVCHKAKRKN